MTRDEAPRLNRESLSLKDDARSVVSQAPSLDSHAPSLIGQIVGGIGNKCRHTDPSAGRFTARPG
jgi:hypothetical protein